MRYASLAAAVGMLFTAGVALAGTKVQGNVVTDSTSAPSGVDPAGKSKFKMDGAGNYQFGLKGITDNTGNPAAVTSPGSEYISIVKGDAAGTLWEFNILTPITKAGSAKVKGSAASLLGLVPPASSVGVLGAEVHETPTAPNAAACQANIASGTAPLLIKGVWVAAINGGPNPCASGARIGISGVVTP